MLKKAMPMTSSLTLAEATRLSFLMVSATDIPRLIRKLTITEKEEGKDAVKSTAVAVCET